MISNENNLSKEWSIIKQIINRRKGSKINEKLIHSSWAITDLKAISNGFNNYFVNIGPTLASKIPNNNVSHRRFLPENLNFSLFLEPTNETEVNNIIDKLKEGAPGRHGMLSKNIKLIKDSFSYLLANTVNLSFEQGDFSDDLKIAVITPLYKAKDPMFFNNYRPVSLLSVFIKNHWTPHVQSHTEFH